MNKLSRRDFLKISASGTLAFVLAEMGISPNLYVNYDKEIANLDLNLSVNPEEIYDHLKALDEGEYEKILSQVKFNPYLSKTERNLKSDLDFEWYEFGKLNIPEQSDLPDQIINASPFAGIRIEDVPVLAALINETDSSIKLDKVLKACPPCCLSDIYPELMEEGRFGPRVKALYSRVKEVSTVLERITALTMCYSNILFSSPNHAKKQEIEEEIEALSDILSSLKVDYYLLPLFELLGRTSCRNLISAPEVHPESTHYHPDLSLDWAPVNCNGWVMRIIDIVSQIQNKPELSPVTIDENGNYIVKNGEKVMGFNTMVNWMKNESIKNGWKDISDFDYKQIFEESKDHLIVCLGYIGNEPKNINHMFIVRRGNIKDKDEILLVAELDSNPPNGVLYLPVDPTNPEKLDGQNGMKVLKYSCPLN